MPRRAGLVDRRAMREAAAQMLAEVGATGIAPDAPAATLRAGEQQLVEIARAAARKPRLLILDEPTSSLTPHEGLAVLVASSEIPEIVALCDRVAVLSCGRVSGVLARDEIDEAHILRLAFGAHE